MTTTKPSVIEIIKRVPELSGHASRREYWISSLAVVAVCVAAGALLIAAAISLLPADLLLISAAIILAAALLCNFGLLLPVSIRRCRDSGLPGRWVLYALAIFLLTAVVPVLSYAGTALWLAMSLWLALAPSRARSELAA